MDQLYKEYLITSQVKELHKTPYWTLNYFNQGNSKKMTTVSADCALVRNRFETRQLRKTIGHMDFALRNSQNRLDNEMKTVRSSLKDIHLNTGHSSDMDPDSIRNFCRGKYTSSTQRKGLELVERGGSFDWTLAFDRDVNTVQVPEKRVHSPRKCSDVKRSASMIQKQFVPLTKDESDNNPTLKRSSSFQENSTNKRSSLRRRRIERHAQIQSNVLKLPNAQLPSGLRRTKSLRETDSKPPSNLTRSSSVTNLPRDENADDVGRVGKSRSIESIDTMAFGTKESRKSQPNSHDSHIKLPQLFKTQSMESVKTTKEREHHVKRDRGNSPSCKINVTDLTDLVQELELDSNSVSDIDFPVSKLQRGSRKTKKKKDISNPKAKPAWDSNADFRLSIPEARVTYSSTSCPLPEGHKGVEEKGRVRQLSCPEEDGQKTLMIPSEYESSSDVFDSAASGEQDDVEIPVSREALKKKVQQVRAENSGMSFAELVTKKQRSIRVAMSPRDKRRIREQIIAQRLQRDQNPSAGEQARFRYIEGKVRSFFGQEVSSVEGGTQIDSYYSEEEGSLV